MITMLDLGWAAGFLEGEGSFVFKGSPTVSAGQLTLEPLLKLQSLFGGKIRVVKASIHRKNPLNVWYADSSGSAAIMMTLYSLMSARRQEKIREALIKWKNTGLRKRAGHLDICIRGHSITGDNVVMVPGRNGKKYARCKICRYKLEPRSIGVVEEELW